MKNENRKTAIIVCFRFLTLCPNVAKCKRLVIDFSLSWLVNRLFAVTLNVVAVVFNTLLVKALNVATVVLYPFASFFVSSLFN